ncbi:hypothetical protein ILYODFUR_038685 [Ilyodon furcidens]|uniref:Uncharacterized protein n=1 Tax=Ilyodon furcidens TaxID=33524 RepID=A0ABV0URA5_9TELE
MLSITLEQTSMMSSEEKTETISKELTEDQDPELRILVIGGAAAEKTLVIERIQTAQSLSLSPMRPALNVSNLRHSV